MTNGLPQSPNGDGIEAKNPAGPSDVEQIIEQIGARYIQDLRMLTEHLSRFYQAEVTVRDRQVTELTQRVATVERERDQAEARLRDREQVTSQYLADLRALNEKISWRMEAAVRATSELAAHEEVP